MDYQDLYIQTIAKLKNYERPLIKLTPELINELKNHWTEAFKRAEVDSGVIKKIVCILDNTQNMTSEFNDLFLMTLSKIKDQELLIYTLSASQKHVISESLRSGHMISSQYFEHLKVLLKNKNPEVVEWTLRTIETMGPLSLRFKNDVRAARPGILRFLNQHQKSSSQIIDLMEKQWEKMRL